MPWAHMRTGTRLTLGFLGVLFFLAATGVLATVAMWSLQSDYARVTAMRGQAGLAERWAQNTRLNVNRVMALAQSRNDVQVKGYFDPLMADTTQQINEMQKTLEAALAPEDQTLLAQVGELRSQYIAVRKRFFALLQVVAEPSSSEGGMVMPDPAEPADNEAAALLTGELLPAANAYMAAQESLVAHLRQTADALEQEAQVDLQQAVIFILLLALAAFALGMGVAYFTTRSITQPLRQAVAFAGGVAQGDLTCEIRSSREDEFGELLRSLDAMQTELRRVIGHIRQSSESIGTASAEVALGNQDLSQRTEQAASSLEETASSMEQLTATVRQSAEAARQANQMAASAAEVAQRGGAVVGQVVTTMEAINHSSRKISDIIGVIDGIAFQTNILALNAAVEAARAGEQGRGFAVVAGEVRTLAQRSAQAAKEIKELIGNSVDKVQDGSRLVQAAGATMTDIVSSVQRVTDIIGEITAATAEQSDGIAQVNVAVNQLDQMTQQNAALVEQSMAATESLKAQAVRLTEVIAVFRVGAPLEGLPPPAAVGRIA